MLKTYDCTSCNTTVSVEAKSYPRSVFLCPECKETLTHTRTCSDCGHEFDDRQGGSKFICADCHARREEESHQKICNTCGKTYDNREEGCTRLHCASCKEKIESEKYLCTCERCSRQYDRRTEYADHQGKITRDYCKSCSDEMKWDYAENLIWRANRIKEKYDAGSISHSLWDEMRFKLKMSRNDIRVFGWNTHLISDEYVKSRDRKKTYDHINGMNTIITTTAMRIVDQRLSTEEEVVDFIDRMSCVVAVSQKANTTVLKTLQIGEVTPEEYYNALGGLHYHGKMLTLDEFKAEFSHYFISEN